MDPMRELIGEVTVRRILLFAGWGGPLLGLTLGVVWGGMTRRWREGWRKGLFLGLLGPLAWGMWNLYSYLTRYDPRTDYFGLERVDVLLLNLLLFALVGAALGRAWWWLFDRSDDRQIMDCQGVKDAKNDS